MITKLYHGVPQSSSSVKFVITWCVQLLFFYISDAALFIKYWAAVKTCGSYVIHHILLGSSHLFSCCIIYCSCERHNSTLSSEASKQNGLGLCICYHLVFCRLWHPCLHVRFSFRCRRGMRSWSVHFVPKPQIFHCDWCCPIKLSMSFYAPTIYFFFFFNLSNTALGSLLCFSYRPMHRFVVSNLLLNPDSFLLYLVLIYVVFFLIFKIMYVGCSCPQPVVLCAYVELKIGIWTDRIYAEPYFLADANMYMSES